MSFFSDLKNEVKGEFDTFLKNADAREGKNKFTKILSQFKSEVGIEIKDFKKRVEKESYNFKETQSTRLEEPSPTTSDLVYTSDEHRNKIIKDKNDIWNIYQGEIIPCTHEMKYIQCLFFRGYIDGNLLYCQRCYSVLYGDFASASDNHTVPSRIYAESPHNIVDFTKRTEIKVNRVIENLIPNSTLIGGRY
ncbi:MAG: hypothetical protein COB02_07945 [Candidatus Cloacimonadota bacterium]|nr:MAG: hypothetical protein COB02_07945 [Candidatus Cloacimonadota bacterium]